jgi:TonB family protein
MLQLGRTPFLVGSVLTLCACAARAADPHTLPPCSEALTAELPPKPTPDQVRAVRDSLRALGEDPEKELVFGAYDRAPELTNRRIAAAAVRRHFPSALMDAERQGTIIVWTLVDHEGSVRASEISRSSGQLALDHAAVAALREFSFSPAIREGCRAAVWIRLPVTFSVREESA